MVFLLLLLPAALSTCACIIAVLRAHPSPHDWTEHATASHLHVTKRLGYLATLAQDELSHRFASVHKACTAKPNSSSTMQIRSGTADSNTFANLTCIAHFWSTNAEFFCSAINRTVQWHITQHFDQHAQFYVQGMHTSNQGQCASSCDISPATREILSQSLQSDTNGLLFYVLSSVQHLASDFLMRRSAQEHLTEVMRTSLIAWWYEATRQPLVNFLTKVQSNLLQPLQLIGWNRSSPVYQPSGRASEPLCTWPPLPISLPMYSEQETNVCFHKLYAYLIASISRKITFMPSTLLKTVRAQAV